MLYRQIRDVDFDNKDNLYNFAINVDSQNVVASDKKQKRVRERELVSKSFFDRAKRFENYYLSLKSEQLSVNREL